MIPIPDIAGESGIAWNGQQLCSDSLSSHAGIRLLMTDLPLPKHERNAHHGSARGLDSGCTSAFKPAPPSSYSDTAACHCIALQMAAPQLSISWCCRSLGSSLAPSHFLMHDLTFKACTCRHGIHCNFAHLADLCLNLLGGCLGALLGICLGQGSEARCPVWNDSGKPLSAAHCPEPAQGSLACAESMLVQSQA